MAYKHIDVKLDSFLIQLYEGGRPVATIREFSIGKHGTGTMTPLIRNGTLSKKRIADYVSHHFKVPMPYAVFFDEKNGCAFHEGNPAVASHGCIHLRRADAKMLFDWVAKDEVSINFVGDYPARSIAPASAAKRY